MVSVDDGFGPIADQRDSHWRLLRLVNTLSTMAAAACGFMRLNIYWARLRAMGKRSSPVRLVGALYNYQTNHAFGLWSWTYIGKRGWTRRAHANPVARSTSQSDRATVPLELSRAPSTVHSHTSRSAIDTHTNVIPRCPCFFSFQFASSCMYIGGDTYLLHSTSIEAAAATRPTIILLNRARSVCGREKLLNGTTCLVLLNRWCSDRDLVLPLAQSVRPWGRSSVKQIIIAIIVSKLRVREGHESASIHPHTTCQQYSRLHLPRRRWTLNQRVSKISRRLVGSKYIFSSVVASINDDGSVVVVAVNHLVIVLFFAAQETSSSFCRFSATTTQDMRQDSRTWIGKRTTATGRIE